MTPNLDTPPRSMVARLTARFLNHAVASPAPEHKRQGGHPLLSFSDIGQPIWAPRDYAAFAREGFMQNAVVYRCVRMIAENAAAVPLLLYDGDTEIEQHPLKTLLRRPSPTATYADLIESFIGYLLVSGNAYLEAVSFGGEIRELHLLRPDRIQVVPGADGWPEAYDYTVDGRTTRIEGEAAPGVRRILHMKLFHPVNDHYGMSPIEAAACAIDLHNSAARWNKALLDNSARPSGALVYTSRDGNLTPDQFERLKSELETNFQGSGNAGRPLLLEGGLDWKAMSMTPKDLDFVEAKNAAAREIALALGVPPMLLGIPGDNTYANYKEANASLWRQSIIPLVNRLATALSEWLAASHSPSSWRAGQSEGRQSYGSGLALIPNLDTIEALSLERDALWSRLESASFLTSDEKRALVGYGPTPLSSTEQQKFNHNHDAFARFATSDDGNDSPQPVAFKPRPPAPPKPPPPKTDFGVPPRGHRYSKHGRDQATERNFSDQRIDAIIQNNGASRVGKVDSLGNETWEYRDSRGNTVVTNEGGGIVTVFSPAPKGIDIEK